MPNLIAVALLVLEIYVVKLGYISAIFQYADEFSFLSIIYN